MLRDLRSLVGLFVMLGFAVVWANLASGSPLSTYHFAPAVIAASWVVVDGSRGAGLTQRRIVNTALGGLVFTLVTIAILETKDDLAGPAFWDIGDRSVLLEHAAFAVVGAIGGAIYAVRIAGRAPRDV